ncbi:hypothetical protein PtA15_8A184 [Puccinia triticina]|uniref:AAA+ ATPase domain-containing protein n=1 Tax=Puccinia triticina TaxID=208348 RepID=A0ABY7CQG5_9BASI|nr:uncharacterized protein PtA15_8A184 [Puccinia triticina]WAQ87280.1 hypothetical protein PtA15_8A184 [Puccinia triticina]
MTTLASPVTRTPPPRNGHPENTAASDHPISCDEMMDEAENHQEEDLLEPDPQFGDSHPIPNRTSTERPVPTRTSLPEKRHTDLTDPSQPALVQRIKREAPTFDPPVSFDEMMDEAENYQEEDLLEPDPQFGDSHPIPNRTSTERPVPTRTSLPEKRHTDLTDPSQPAPVERVRRQAPTFDPPVSFDEMMDEAENYQEEDFLELDSQFGDIRPNRPPFERLVPTRASLPEKRYTDVTGPRIRREAPTFDPPVSIDEMMDEAENYQGEDFLEMDSQFGDSHPNRPTSAQRPIPTLPEERQRDLADPSQPRWIPTTSIVATKLDGTKIRIPRRKKIGSTQVTRGGSKSTEALQKQCLELLDEPIHRMLQAVREEILHKDVLAAASASLPPKVENPNPGPRSLWTDRYRPAKFIDLIGDERTFRSAMSWLKTWDRCVFKKIESKKRKRDRSQPQWGSSAQSNLFAEAAETDPYGRPQEKVLLLAGKPGLGKTTMAEVLATQAGYQVIEINASDDRSSRTVTDQIKSALESRTLDAGAKFGGGLSLKSNRPTCVIIDEIDGAAAGGGGGGGAGGNEAGFVKALVKLVTEGSTNVTKVNSKGKSLDQRPLLRPIICICNDLYAPVLRPLRPISRIIRFNNPTPLTIVKRLQTICKSEKLLADLNNLNYLVKLASGDLRSCLNTLQFISTQSTTLTDQIIKSAVEASVKDSGSSIQTVLSHLFKIPVRKSASKKDPSGSKDVYLTELIRDISACGQNDRVVQGCFESYLTMKQPTDLWRTYERLHDWLEFYDRLETKIWKDQEYQLSSYVPYSIAIWRELMGNVTNKAPDYPKVEYEHFLKRSINEETLSTFNANLPPVVKASFKSREVVCELLPFLIRILSVDLRPVNSKLIKKEEKEVLSRLVSIMIELGLRFVQDKGEDGQLSYTLEPAVDFPVYYEGKRPVDIPPPRYSVRQMILNEMNLLARARKQDRPTASDKTPGTAASIINAYKQKPNALKPDLPEKAALDFFGRKRIETNQQDKTGPTTGQKDLPKEKVKILYRYHEGFSNAVKKGITFNELMSK